jgi:AcrR family transcriptional regulator
VPPTRREGSISPQTAKSVAPRIPPRPPPEDAGADARERIVRTAYELFTCHGLNAVGVDRVVAEANVAKTTLYRHFRSKDALIVEVLERHHQLWLRDWLEPRTRDRGDSPVERLLGIFDTFDEWLGDENFQGCLFINSLAEMHDRASPARLASIKAIDDVYLVLVELAVEAGAREPERLARQIHLLVRGTIVAATEGHRDAVHEGREAARQLIEQALPRP